MAKSPSGTGARDKAGAGTKSDGAQAMSRLEIEEIVHELENAGAETADWLARFHRSAICKVEPDRDLIAPDAAGHTHFGTWYLRTVGTAIFDQPAFAGLATIHDALLSHASILAARAWKDSRVPVQEYDALLEKHRAFDEQARRLARAFRAALSELDPLTGTHTRQGMEKELSREQHRAARSRQPACIALADIDHFKRVNDTYGHLSGDRVLAVVTRLLIDSLRPYDSIFRFGGEEFLLCLPDTNIEDALHTLNRVRERIAAEPLRAEDGTEFFVTCSFGITLLRPKIALRQLIERADQSLYFAKQHGRDQVRAWEIDLAR